MNIRDAARDLKKAADQWAEAVQVAEVAINTAISDGVSVMEIQQVANGLELNGPAARAWGRAITDAQRSRAGKPLQVTRPTLRHQS